ncbi:MAG: Glutamate formimidoyltransferase [Owenweeksia sp. TMED14]|nr:MAG: Glutamate formimidoyltransferase [Owenweeksia sp. TMED14]|tara:strand:- start:2071 stop:2967 length:897 start_codon:yes stop_codon:yes gene_type:complete
MLECVANISEGSSSIVLNDIESSLISILDIQLLHIDIGKDANRTVFTFVGNSSSITLAVIAVLKKCTELIDMTHHQGNHPRIGAFDVCPIIPLYPSTIIDARNCVKNIVNEINIQNINVGGWMYGESAIVKENFELSNVRRGGYEMISRRYNNFDFGIFNEYFGAMAIGARELLLAYNVNLESLDISAAKAIASIIRESSSNGIPGVRSIGWNCNNYRFSQISCNIVDLVNCTPKMVFDRVSLEAKKMDIEINGSELIGMAPRQAFRDFTSLNYAQEYLGLNSNSEFVLKNRILEEKI